MAKLIDSNPFQVGILDVEKASAEEIFLSLMNSVPFKVMLIDSEHNIILANHGTYLELNEIPDLLAGHKCPHFQHNGKNCYACPVAVSTKTNKAHQLISKEDNAIYFSGAYPTEWISNEGNRIFMHFKMNISDLVSQFMTSKSE